MTGLQRFQCAALAGVVAISLAGSRTVAAVAGAWEAFETEVRAGTWTVYDFADEEAYLPLWDDSDDVPLIYFTHVRDAPLWFYATDEFGGEALVGDYAAAGIQAVRCTVFIDDLDEFGSVDCVILADGPAGLRYYYSTPFVAGDFDGDGWWNLRFGFDEPWFYLGGSGYVEVPVTEGLLASIQVMGFQFFPRQNTTVDTVAALTDVLLEPTVEAPRLEVGVDGSTFRLEFAMAAANLYTIERLQMSGTAWREVVGQTDLLGPGQHVFTRPVTAEPGIFRVVAEAFYTPIGDP